MPTVNLAASIFFALLLASLSALVSAPPSAAGNQHPQGFQVPAQDHDRFAVAAVDLADTGRPGNRHRQAPIRATVPPMGEIIPGAEQ
jgi:hypothetical protein